MTRGSARSPISPALVPLASSGSFIRVSPRASVIEPEGSAGPALDAAEGAVAGGLRLEDRPERVGEGAAEVSGRVSCSAGKAADVIGHTSRSASSPVKRCQRSIATWAYLGSISIA